MHLVQSSSSSPRCSSSTTSPPLPSSLPSVLFDVNACLSLCLCVLEKRSVIPISFSSVHLHPPPPTAIPHTAFESPPSPTAAYPAWWRAAKSYGVHIYKYTYEKEKKRGEKERECKRHTPPPPHGK